MKKISFLALCLLASAGLFAQTQVTADKTGVELQAAIDAAQAGDTVYVQAGTFYGNFTMKEGVNVSGGWNAEFTAQTDYATILDAQANGRVLDQPAAFTTLTVWSNLTIQNGDLKEAAAGNLGSGVALNKKGQVKHCLIQNNTYSYTSGNCMGGGVGNDAVDANTDVLVDDCIVRNNKGTHGGGVRVRGTVINSIIEGNLTEANACGGVHLQAGRLINCIVRGNTGKDTGGVRAYGKCEVINNLIYNNTGVGSIGGVSLESAVSTVIGNTIVANNQLGANNASRCGVRLNVNGELPFYNNIVWGNMVNGVVQADQMNFHDNYKSTHAAVAFKNNAVVLAETIGENTILLPAELNPGFADPAKGDYTLLYGSKLINAGLTSAVTVETDLAGNDRVINGAVDLGAYENTTIAVTADKTGAELQAAIDAAKAGWTIYVQAGTYYGNFTMKEGVNVSGGWNAEFTAQTDYASILDAQAEGRVLDQPAAFTTLTVWSNFTIQNGNLKTAMTGNLGSGVALNKKGQVKHCLIQNNTYSYTSGNCMGGGVGNDAVDANTDVLVDDCIVRNNKGTHGGGVRVRGTVINSIIENNLTEANAAGGVHLQGGRLINCIVRGNTGKDTGGVRAYGACQVINNLICNNTAMGSIGGLSQESNISTIIGNTIVGNNQVGTSNASRCGVRIKETGAVPFYNNIVWGNMANGVVQADQMNIAAGYVSDQAPTMFLNNAITMTTTLGTNTILLAADENPGFADITNGDFRLVWTSPLLDKGDNKLVTVEQDLLGAARIQGTSVDLGCYELPYYTLTVAAFENATLTVNGMPMVAGEYTLPQGFMATATIVAAEGYAVKNVMVGETEIVAVEGVYTLPALMANAMVTINVEKKDATAIDQTQTEVQSSKVLRNGQLYIIRGEKMYDTIGRLVK